MASLTKGIIQNYAKNMGGNMETLCIETSRYCSIFIFLRWQMVL